MGRRKREVFTDEASGLQFVFLYDRQDPSRLHIEAAHSTSPQEAIDTFFQMEPTWNDANLRYETVTETHGVYWTWMMKGIAVLVISCFRRENP